MKQYCAHCSVLWLGYRFTYDLGHRLKANTKLAPPLIRWSRLFRDVNCNPRITNVSMLSRYPKLELYPLKASPRQQIPAPQKYVKKVQNLKQTGQHAIVLHTVGAQRCSGQLQVARFQVPRRKRGTCESTSFLMGPCTILHQVYASYALRSRLGAHTGGPWQYR